MERAAWTDERLDDLARRMDAGFERLDADLRQLRDQVVAQGAELREQIAAQGAELRDQLVTQGSELRDQIATQGVGLRGEMTVQGGELRGEIAALRTTMIRVGGGIMAGLVGVIAAVLAGGG
jgi:hypothetical protein